MKESQESPVAALGWRFFLEKDSEGNWFITTSCQGLGASVWWPCKDHMYDEADSMLISITVPKKLQDISNRQNY